MGAVHCSPLSKGYHEPAELNLCYTSVEKYHLEEAVTIETGDLEHCLMVLSGKVSVDIGAHSYVMEKLDSLFLPPGGKAIVRGEGAELIRFAAPSDTDGEPVLISFKEIDKDPERHRSFGSAEHGTRRDVWMILNDSFSCSRLMIGICRGADGNWTAWPPHEHGVQREEVYYYFGMAPSFGVQLVYDSLQAPWSAVVSDGDLVSIPGGYHPNTGSPGGGISYIYCMVATTSGNRTFMDLKIQDDFAEKFVGEMK